MKKAMRYTIGLAMIVGVILLNAETKAQTYPGITVQTGFSQICHEHPTQCPANPRTVGRNNFISLYPLNGVPFATSISSMSCAYDPVTQKYPTLCNGVRVWIQTLQGFRYIQLNYVSPTQINAIADFEANFGSEFSGGWIDVFKPNGELGHHQNNLYFNNILALSAGDIAGGNFCQRGDVYNAATGAYIQYAGLCAPFPKEASGQPTIVQIYFGGKYFDSQRFDVWVNGVQTVNDGVGSRIQNDGWYVINVPAPPGGWLTGNNVVKIMDSAQSGTSAYFETAVVVGQP